MFYSEFYLINQGIDFMFGKCADIRMRRKCSKGWDKNFTFAHEIHEFGIVITIFFPNRIRYNAIKFTNPCS